MHFYSGPLMHLHSGVDRSGEPLDKSKNDRLETHCLTYPAYFQAGEDWLGDIVRKIREGGDPKFEEKFWERCRAQRSPAYDQALVLCCDEKSQCQALERTQLGLPLAAKRPRTMTHDYVRHGRSPCLPPSSS